MPEIVWKSYINIEISIGDYDRVRELYSRLLNKTKHIKVWISYSKFEQECDEFINSRNVLDTAYKYFKQSGLKEERLVILENWIKLEENIENGSLVEVLRNRLPTRIKRRRKINKNSENEDAKEAEEINNEEGWEEYFDYIFPDDEEATNNLKILDHAKKWHSLKKIESN
jgi:crooked neck